MNPSLTDRPMRCGWRALGAGLTVFAIGGCASLHQRPLRQPAESLPPPPELESPRLRVRAAEVKHPALAPVRVDLSDGLNPDEAAVLAVLLDPQLVAARSEHDVGRAQVLDAGILPNPVFGIAVDHPFGSGANGTTNLLDLSLSMNTRSLVSRGARRSAAQASLAQIDLGIAWQEWQVAEQARLLTVRLAWLRRRAELAQKELAFEQKTADALEGASSSGDATLEQVGVQRAALESVRRTVDDLDQSATNTESDLRALLGEPHIEPLAGRNADAARRRRRRDSRHARRLPRASPRPAGAPPGLHRRTGTRPAGGAGAVPGRHHRRALPAQRDSVAVHWRLCELRAAALQPEPGQRGDRTRHTQEIETRVRRSRRIHPQRPGTALPAVRSREATATAGSRLDPQAGKDRTPGARRRRKRRHRSPVVPDRANRPVRAASTGGEPFPGAGRG